MTIPSELLADEQLVRLVCGGQPQLFELLVRRHNRRLYRAIRAIVRDDGEVEELMQQTYVQAFSHLAQFEGRAKFSTWLTRIAVHAAFAHVRHARREQPTGADADELSGLEQESDAMDAPSARTNPERLASEQELRVLLTSAIDGLPEHYRTVFVLRALEGMSLTETAECLSLHEDTVKTRFFRARALLRKSLLDRADAVLPSALDFHLSRCDRVVVAVLERLGLRRDGERS